MIVKPIMHKGLLTVSGDLTVKQAAEEMFRLKVGAVIIGTVDNMAGIFSERDLLNKVVGQGLSVETTLIKEVMTRNLLTVNESENINTALQIMESKGIRHLPVVNDAGVGVGMLGMRDLMKNMVEHLERENNALSELDKLKDEFLANTSHELRTPLNGIIGIAESMIDGAAGELSPKQVFNLSMISASGRRLFNLVNDVLDFSKLKHKSIDLEIKPVGVRDVTDVVLSVSKHLIGNKPLVLVNSVNPDLVPVDADENRLQQILYNLVGNSVKFTDSGSIEVSAKVTGDYVEITVSDTGIGIPEDKLERIFESFEQVEGVSARQYGGTGIGLTITKQLIELHGGTVRVESVLNKGSKFTFNLPVSRTKAEPAQNIKLEQAQSSFLKENTFATAEISKEIRLPGGGDNDENSGEGFKILIVDDEPINLQVLNNQLSLKNYTITQAINGIEALAALEAEKDFDLILLDIMMPKMSGYEVCQKIREIYPASELPVVMLTAKTQVSDVVEGFEMGANDYLTKPFSKNELFARIKTHLQLAKINMAYSRFVPSEFLSFLGHESIVEVKLGDQVLKDMTVLFSDIRSFTTLSEKMTPKENFDFINSYLSKVSPAIRNNQGFIDKYIGDAIMALFPHSAENALTASVEMLKELAKINEKREQQGYEKIEIGIGLHNGTLMLGIVGENKRMDGTVIADAVNLASRLEGLTKVYGASIIISGDFLEHLENPAAYNYRFLDKVQVKGKNSSIAIFEIFDGETPDIFKLKLGTKADFARGVELYNRKEFETALTFFRKVLEMNPKDKAAAIYEKRCENFLKYGIEEEWDGVAVLTEK
jgi:two-component system sensor histidine kinase ChiS